jgi:hypothetical protein
MHYFFWSINKEHYHQGLLQNDLNFEALSHVN